MSGENNRPEPIHLKEEELLGKLPEKIGNVTLNYQYYPGEDLYSDGSIEDELLDIPRYLFQLRLLNVIRLFLSKEHALRY